MWYSAVGCIVTLTLSLLAAPHTATAQPQSTVPRIGILATAAEASNPLWEAFRHGLRDLGYVEGKTIALEYRFAAGQNERLPGAGRRAGPSPGGPDGDQQSRRSPGRQGRDRDDPHRDGDRCPSCRGQPGPARRQHHGVDPHGPRVGEQTARDPQGGPAPRRPLLRLQAASKASAASIIG